jgi:DNA-binding HxlR family transcriptional regulator
MRKARSTNSRNEAQLIATCPLAAAMALIGGRWKILILYYIGHGLTRYGQIHATISGISGKMLYQQLRELERDGLVLRIMAGRATSYRLTALGRSLLVPLSALEGWSRDNAISDLVVERRRAPIPA